MTPDDMEGRLLADAEDMAAQDAGILGISKRSRRLNDLASDLRALLLDYQERGRALERQCDNMAFAINRVDLRGWTEKFSRELKEDRATLKGKSHD